MAFQKKSRAGLVTETEEGGNIFPPNKIVQKNIVIDIYEYIVKIIFQNNYYF